jgi:hypothetical protein
MMEVFLQEICDSSHFHLLRSLVEGICGLKVVEEGLGASIALNHSN